MTAMCNLMIIKNALPNTIRYPPACSESGNSKEIRLWPIENYSKGKVSSPTYVISAAPTDYI